MNNSNPTKTSDKIGLSTGVPKGKTASTPLVLHKSNTLVTNPVKSHEWGQDHDYNKRNISVVIVAQIFRYGYSSHGSDREAFDVMYSAYPLNTLGLVDSLFTATLYYDNHDRNHKLRNMVSTEK
jgi:hypothetical protein